MEVDYVHRFATDCETFLYLLLLRLKVYSASPYPLRESIYCPPHPKIFGDLERVRRGIVLSHLLQRTGKYVYVLPRDSLLFLAGGS